MPDATFDQLGAAAALATRQYPTLSDIAYRRAAQTMIEAGRRDRAAAFLVSQLKLVPDVKEDLVFDTFALAASNGDADCINALLDTIDKPEWIDAIILKAGVTDEVPEEPDKKRVELAYILGVVLNDAGRDQLAELAYRRALALNPDHPWSNNNLGYQIAEAHGDLREAEAMLRRALAALPEEGSVLDSLAWILYKQGRLNDEVGPDGRPSPGAVALLARASTSMRGSENPVILDHYGDALWSAGKTDQARQAWTQARQAVKNRLQMLRLANTNAPPSRAIQRDETLLAQIAAKLDALDAGRQPTLAEQPGVQSPASPAGK
jgi:tetratricopeptide (TPR) repeat protein